MAQGTVITVIIALHLVWVIAPHGSAT